MSLWEVGIMRRRTNQLLVTMLLGGMATAMGVGGAPAAHAVPTPITGDVACDLAADSTFKPALGYQRGKVGPRVGPLADAKWKVLGQLTGCSGTQTGGRARQPGPIVRGELLLRARGIGHRCEGLTANGMTVTAMRIKWFDALDNVLLPTRATGTVSVAGLGNGSPWVSFNPPVVDPGFVYPGVITFTVTATALPTSRAFPGDAITMTAVADETISMMQLPCSFTYPPVSLGVPALGFHAVHGASSLAVS